jgi:hypothetical protein
VSAATKDYVDCCRAKVTAQLASYRKVLAAKPAGTETFETAILKFRTGDEIRLDADQFARSSGAFFDEVEAKFR